MSELRELALAVRMLGESCAKLSDHRHGAVASLREASNVLSSTADTGDLAIALNSVSATWNEIETEAKGAAMEAHRFGSRLAN